MAKKQILLSVTGQVLSCTNEDSLHIASGSIGQYEVVVTLDDWWTDYDVSVQFRKYGIVIENSLDEENTCSDFDAILASGGSFEVTVFGLDTSGNEKTTNPVSIDVSDSGLRNSAPVTFLQSIWNKIRIMLAGGTTGQFLRKTSDVDYEAEWVDGYDKGEIDSLFNNVYTAIETDITISDNYEYLAVPSSGFTFEYVPVEAATHATTEPYYATTGYVGADTNPVIPYIYDDGVHGSHKVEKVNMTTFYENSDITSVTIPRGIIEFYGLYLCTSVQYISIPYGVETLYLQESSLIRLTVPSSVNSIYCKGSVSLETVVFNEGISILSASAFEGCAQLSKIHFPDSLEYIGDRAFYQCTALEAVDFPRGLKEIGISAFQYSGLIDAFFNNSSPILKKQAFASCDNLIDVIDLKTTSIGESCFRYDMKLGYINLPNVEYIGRYAFNCCMNLKLADFSDTDISFCTGDEVSAFMFNWDAIKAHKGYSTYDAAAREADFPGLSSDIYNAIGSTNMILPYLYFQFPSTNLTILAYTGTYGIPVLYMTDSGATGTFTTAGSETVTVKNGIITSIV